MDADSSGRTAWEGLDRDLLPVKEVKEQLECMELCLGRGVPVPGLCYRHLHPTAALGNAALERLNDNFPTWGTNKERCSAGPHTYNNK